jgi:hypothetical protein
MQIAGQEQPSGLFRIESLFWIEFYFDGFRGFMRGGFPFPSSDGISRRLNQKRMPAFYGYVLYDAVAGNEGFDFHDATQMHAASKGRILGCDFGHHFSIARLHIFLSRRIG